MKSRFTTLAGSALVLASLGMTGTAAAAGASSNNLPVQDTFTTTIIDKSIIDGAVRKEGGVIVVVDNDGNKLTMAQIGAMMQAAATNPSVLMQNHVYFDYAGQVVSVDTNERTGQLEKVKEQIGTIKGTAQFPMAFAMGSMGMKAYMEGMGPMPMFPAVIDWTCADCTMVVNGVTYKGIKDNGMGLDGRAFTGLGPVEVGQISAQSMTVRLAGCSAVAGDNGKVGTLCMNSSLSFDLSQINLAPGYELTSEITGKGTSNCTTVLHQPMM